LLRRTPTPRPSPARSPSLLRHPPQRLQHRRGRRPHQPRGRRAGPRRPPGPPPAARREPGGVWGVMPAPRVNPWMVTIAVTVGTLMGALDTSIVNVALPYIRANLGVTITEVAWISTGYIIAL